MNCPQPPALRPTLEWGYLTHLIEHQQQNELLWLSGIGYATDPQVASQGKVSNAETSRCLSEDGTNDSAVALVAFGNVRL